MPAEVFRIIAKEIESGSLDPATWTRAFGECDGDKDKAKALYIRLRHTELTSAIRLPTESVGNMQSSERGEEAVFSPPANSELDRIRQTLLKQLTLTGKSSLYANLGVTPKASDADIAKVVASTKLKGSMGEVIPSEVKYAIEALGDPVRRETYDRRLLEILSQPIRAQTDGMITESAGSDSTFLSWWGTSKVSALIAISAVLMFGALSLGFFKTKANKDIATGVVANQREAIQVVGENDAYRADTERRAVGGILENQATAIDQAARIANRREDTNQRALEYSANYGAAQIEMQKSRLEAEQNQAAYRRQQQEQDRVASEQRASERASQQLEASQKRQDCSRARQLKNAGEVLRACN
jgi:hypothetical protein